MTSGPLFTTPHRRQNALTGEWVLVSPQRAARPWQGQVEQPPAAPRLAYDPDCYLCPGNARAGGARNPPYEATFVFDNDFAALLSDGEWRDSPESRAEAGGEGRDSGESRYAAGEERRDAGESRHGAGDLLRAEGERGLCRVVCYSPRHDLTLAGMTPADVRRVVDTWADQFTELAALPWVRHLQIFENRGALMGASNPHPHGQIWANETLPNEPAKELARQTAYTATAGRCLLCDYVAAELAAGERIVVQNEHWLAVVPFWAVWPFETLLLPRAHRDTLPALPGPERDALADILGRLTRRYNRLFDVLFPYSMGFHQPPTDGAAYPAWHLHAHFYPPLLRSATVRKFMVGYELLGQPQRDITPESAAARLRELPEE